MRSIKVFNNNAVSTVMPDGREAIVLGKGIGFNKRPGDVISERLIEKVYYVQNEMQTKFLQMLQDVRPDVMEAAERIIAMAEQDGFSLSNQATISLIDHISFAIKRKQEGIAFSNPLQGAIMCYYPTEYRLGQYCLRLIREQTQVDLSESEAAFIALHIVNAELNTNMSDMYEITRMIEGTLAVVEYYYQKTYDRESLDFSRFVVHLRYFAQRLFQGQAIPDGSGENDALFRQMIARSCKQHYRCAQCVGDYVRNTYHKELTEEELIYLTIHLKRINTGGK